MPILQDILYKVNIRSIQGPLNIEVKSIQTDSRKSTAGGVFVAVKGVHTDGHQFIDTVVKQGALAIVCEVMPLTQKEGITYVQVENSAMRLAILPTIFMVSLQKK